MSIVDLVGILIHLILIFGSISLIIYSFRGLSNLKPKNKKNAEKLTGSFLAGISSGIVVLVFGWWIDNFDFPSIDTSSINNFLMSFLAGLLSLASQTLILLALSLWAIYILLKQLIK